MATADFEKKVRTLFDIYVTHTDCKHQNRLARISGETYLSVHSEPVVEDHFGGLWKEGNEATIVANLNQPGATDREKWFDG